MDGKQFSIIAMSSTKEQSSGISFRLAGDAAKIWKPEDVPAMRL
jgi:hypothetical protein